MPSRLPYRLGRSKTGLGLFATRRIEKGERIAKYWGRKLLNKDYEDYENKYLFEINSRWTIDGSNRRNLARYINHSCRPNAESDIIRHDIFIDARKTILPGEEITYDYGKDHFNGFIKPKGCLCDKCVEKRRAERAEKRAASRAKAKRAARAGTAKPKTKSARNGTGKNTSFKNGSGKSAVGKRARP